MTAIAEFHWLARTPIGFLVALALGLYFTPILRDAAVRFGIVDHPDGKLKRHAAPTPYLGGIAIFLAFLIALGLTIRVFEHQMLGLMLGASIVLMLGLVDDLKALSPMVKLLGQLLAAFVLVKAGVRIEVAAIRETSPFLCDALTIVWVVGITNAFNLIDVMDGLAAGVAAIALLVLAAVALLGGDAAISLFLACLAGAVLGFLRFNRKPASVFLGDAGSMLIGFLTGASAMLLQYAEVHPVAAMAPVLILGVPIFDTALVIVLRAMQGRPVTQGSPDHFAVRLRRAGYAERTIVRGAWATSIALGVVGVSLRAVTPGTAFVLVTACVAAAIGLAVRLARTGGDPIFSRATPTDVSPNIGRGPGSPG